MPPVVAINEIAALFIRDAVFCHIDIMPPVYVAIKKIFHNAFYQRHH